MNNISITFRHVEPSDAIKQHAEDKVLKLQRFLRQPMSARITLSLEKLEHGAEIRISSGGSTWKLTRSAKICTSRSIERCRSSSARSRASRGPRKPGSAAAEKPCESGSPKMQRNPRSNREGLRARAARRALAAVTRGGGCLSEVMVDAGERHGSTPAAPA